MIGGSGSYLEDGRVPAAAVAQLFAAAEILYHLAPWKVADDDQVLRLDIPEIGVEGACLSIIGGLGESYGLVIFPSRTAYDAFGQAPERWGLESGPIDLGSDYLSLSFERGADLSSEMRREVGRYGWPVADANAYPRVEARERDAASRPLTERDVGIASACAASLAAFFANHRALFEVDEFEPVCESYFDDNGPEVRFTFPYEAFWTFDVPDDGNAPPKADRKVGRNDPCPCGSGKKYKKCHLSEDEGVRAEAARERSVGRIGEELTSDIYDFALERFGPAWIRKAADAFFVPEDSLQLLIPYAVYHVPFEGCTAAECFLEARGRRMTRDAASSLRSELEAWLSIWKVVESRAGEGLVLRDRLSGEVWEVSERTASQTLVRGDTVLARLVENDGVRTINGLFPRALPPFEAAEVERRARGYLRRKRDVPVDRLRDPKFVRYLIRRFDEAVDDLDAGVPDLCNTDGDAILFTTDYFDFAPAERHEIELKIAAMEGSQPPEQVGTDLSHEFLGSDQTVLGQVVVGNASLRLQANSIARTDRLRAGLEEACAGRLKHRARDHLDPLSEARKPADDSGGILLHDDPAQTIGREIKERHYDEWLDTSLPALAGQTPRAAAAGRSEGRVRLEALVEQIEYLEQRLEPEERFDVDRIRAALGLDR